MEQKSMTALVSAFARAYHSKNNYIKVFDDFIAERLINSIEYKMISKSMMQGISLFNPSFTGNQDEALRWIVDNQLSPSPLGRAAFAEKALENAVKIGASQYLIFAAGYGTFAYRQPSWAKNIQIFEIDCEATQQDKLKRIYENNIYIPNNLAFIQADFIQSNWQQSVTFSQKFSQNKISFCSMLGLLYYISKENLKHIVLTLGTMVPKGSAIAFDYPDELSFTENAGVRAKKQSMLAQGAKEKMLVSYSYSDMEKLLSDCGFLIYEHLSPGKITNQYFNEYNINNPENKMTAFDNVNYCLAVKM